MDNRMNILAIGLMLIGQTAISDPFQNSFEYKEGGRKFDKNELSLDLYGIGETRNRENFAEDDTIGLGAGVNYYFTRYFGVGAATYIDDWEDRKSVV